jgi:tetratricopeptide (TPR) repeat protein
MLIRQLVTATAATLMLANAAGAQTQAEMENVERILHAPQTKTSTLSFYAGMYLGSGQNDKALEYYSKMKALYEQKYPAGSAPMIWINSQIALCYFKLNDKDKAVALAKQCLAEADKIPASDKEQLALPSLKIAKETATAIIEGKTPSITSGKIDLAEEERKAVAEAEENKKRGAYSQGYALSLIQLGRVYALEKKYDKAAESYKFAIHIMTDMIGPLHPALAPVLNAYALTLDAIGDQKTSAEMRERIRLIEAAPQAETWAAHMQKGATAFRNKQLDVAETELRKSLELSKTTDDKILSLTTLAHLLLVEKKIEEAEKTNNEALEMQRGAHQENTLDFAGSLSTAGDIALASKNNAKARENYEAAMKILDPLVGANESQKSTRLMMLAIVHRGLGQIAQSEGDAKEAARQEELMNQAIKEHDTVRPL